MNSKSGTQGFQHKPRKRFGQNFLHDENVIRRIIDCIAPGADEHFVEIGPGQGALTRYLLLESGTLDTIELDRDLGFLDEHLDEMIVLGEAGMDHLDGDQLLEPAYTFGLRNIHLGHSPHCEAPQKGVGAEGLG